LTDKSYQITIKARFTESRIFRVDLTSKFYFYKELIMSRSYHVTYKDLRRKTKKEIDEMEGDLDSVLHQLVEKSMVRKKVKKQRKIKKENKQ